MKNPVPLVLLLTLMTCTLQAQSPAQTAAPVQTGGAPLRSGDTIEIRLSGVPTEETTTFNAPYTIDDQGMINLPYINQVKAAGLLPNQVQDSIQNRLKEDKIFTHPTITILQTQPRFVNVGGEVKTPQRVPFTSDMTLSSAINAAGWFTDFADQKHIRLTREARTTIYDMRELRKNPATDPKLLPGDQITVPQSFW